VRCPQAGVEEGRPNYAGRGPKGYRRSDENIREDVCEALTRHPEIDASDIDVRVENCEVTLDRLAKRLAEKIAESVPGVADVHNQVKVDR
jgi:osmotically-inducible protein OsmY